MCYNAVEVIFMTLSEWVSEWLRDYKRGMVKPSTYDSYKYYVRNVVCDTELSKVTSVDVQRMISDMAAEGLSTSTIKHMLTLVRQALKKARSLGLVSSLSMLEELELPRRSTSSVEPFSAAEYEKLEQNAQNSIYGDLFLALLYTGARVGELIALRWRDVNLVGGEIHIRNTDYRGKLQPVKTDSGRRTLPIYGDLSTILRRLYRRRTCERVFTNSLGLPCVYRTVLDAWRRFLGNIGIEPCGLHKLRHTFAHRALRAGVPVRVVSAWLGHADVYITLQIYDAIDRDDFRYAAEVLEMQKHPRGSALTDYSGNSGGGLAEIRPFALR